MIEENQASCKNISEKAAEKIREIEAKIEALQRIKELLSGGVQACLEGEVPSAEKSCAMLVP